MKKLIIFLILVTMSGCFNEYLPVNTKTYKVVLVKADKNQARFKDVTTNNYFSVIGDYTDSKPGDTLIMQEYELK